MAEKMAKLANLWIILSGKRILLFLNDKISNY